MNRFWKPAIRINIVPLGWLSVLRRFKTGKPTLMGLFWAVSHGYTLMRPPSFSGCYQRGIHFLWNCGGAPALRQVWMVPCRQYSMRPCLLIENPLHLIRVFMDIPLGALWQFAVAEWAECLALAVYAAGQEALTISVNSGDQYFFACHWLVPSFLASFLCAIFFRYHRGS